MPMSIDAQQWSAQLVDANICSPAKEGQTSSKLVSYNIIWWILWDWTLHIHATKKATSNKIM
jgi:hypothetical protein